MLSAAYVYTDFEMCPEMYVVLKMVLSSIWYRIWYLCQFLDNTVSQMFVPTSQATQQPWMFFNPKQVHSIK